jgi:hypothetical protein
VPSNKKTIVDAEIPYVKTHFEASLKQLERAMHTNAAKFGPTHPVAKGYQEEYNKLATIVATLTEA